MDYARSASYRKDDNLLCMLETDADTKDVEDVSNIFCGASTTS